MLISIRVCYAAVCGLCYMHSLTGVMNEPCWSMCIGGPIAMRTRIRTQRNIQGSICSDALNVAFCQICAIMQMSKEVRDTRPLL